MGEDDDASLDPAACAFLEEALAPAAAMSGRDTHVARTLHNVTNGVHLPRAPLPGPFPACSSSSAAQRRPAWQLQATREAAEAPRMKCKPNQTRTYDPEGFKKRAACLCFRSEREDEVLLVSSSRYPDRWIVPGGGLEPEEEPDGAAVREVYEEAGVKGKLGRLLGVFEQNQDRKHRTYVFVLTVTELLEDWEDSVSIGRKREWFKIEDAIKVLQCHKPVHAEYLEKLKLGGSPTNGNSAAPSQPESEP
ncbi:Diphosphoinositol polyphosphate phosphohydrolase 3-beta [Microtus ochrogaster]|uniref:diphosphoinositol-polyphosphate diphosphatase n=2 Tax=Microtus ochrogaster TaxID=79684 RepID=A0A8J6G1K3_MICOH|nr:Diphosphoinositol polyphosphate phosphohydrolase 3-beta [Microtus ochrogaster]